MEEFDKEKFEKAFDEFRNRKIYKEITLNVLSEIPNEKLEQALFDYIVTKISDDQEEFDVVSKLSAGLQMIFSTWILEGEVNNGGFNQFFFNSSGKFADMALSSLNLLGATEYSEILENAIAIHQREKRNLILRWLYFRRTLKAFMATYKRTSLGECDAQFYKLKTLLSEYRIRYVRSNPTEFLGA